MTLRSLLALPALALVTFAAASPSPDAVTTSLQKVAARHLAEPSRVDLSHWVIAPFYDGLLRAGYATGDASMVAAVVGFGEQTGWSPGYRVYHADDVAVGHAWLDLYLQEPDQAERLGPIQQRVDHILANPVVEMLSFTDDVNSTDVERTDRWSWCDALYMAPPTLAALHRITGDHRYLDFLDQEFAATYFDLYDTQAHFFYRDSRFPGKTNANGHRTFWSRGNGWVFGGLALMLEHYPEERSRRYIYETLFKDMAAAIARVQQPNGLWNPNLDDPAEIPMGEASGSGFFVFGLAWGINQGLLDRDTYWPVVERGWAGLQTCLMPNDGVGYVQPIGFAPDQFGPTTQQDYGTGAFLLAGAEVLRAIGGATTQSPAEILAAAHTLRNASLDTPRAYARLVPERKDDLAWENDKVAFRVYGPALRAGAEDSGIDAWTKRTPRPVIDRWYAMDLEQGISYHQDHGEGFDGYKVGDTRGAGGSGLWIGGKLVTPDTFVAGKIHWTTSDVAEFSLAYRYPITIGGQPLYEHRTVRLRMGERLVEIEAFFSTSNSRGPRPLEGFDPEIAIGLVTQTAAAKLIPAAGPRTIAVYEPFGGGLLGTGVIVGGDEPVRTIELPDTAGKGAHRHVLAITRLGEDKKLVYRTGFAWSADGEITTEAAWLRYLETQR